VVFQLQTKIERNGGLPNQRDFQEQMRHANRSILVPATTSANGATSNQPGEMPQGSRSKREQGLKARTTTVSAHAAAEPDDSFEQKKTKRTKMPWGYGI
jgi:hypothetical protein